MSTPAPDSALARLIQALRHLPGIGPKSAQRLTYHLLQHDRGGAQQIAQAIREALDAVHPCARCNAFTEEVVCRTCADPARDDSLLCVVETPADQSMIEQTLSYKGRYFVLMGHLSPLDGIGPRELKLDKLIERATDGQVREVVLATNFTSEGQATAHYLGEILKQRYLSVTRIARGVPAGGELEYVDVGTIAQAMLDRRAD